jgi:hypothetical protein
MSKPRAWQGITRQGSGATGISILLGSVLLSAAKLSDKHPLTPAPLPQRGEGGSQPAFSSAGASRVRGFIRHCIMQRSVV